MPANIWPLIVIFGSFRNKGEQVIQQMAQVLRQYGLRVKYVKEMQDEFPRPPGMSDDEYNHELSKYAAQKCDFAVFIFFQAKTLGVEKNLESFDQGPTLEFEWFCQAARPPKRALLVFDSYTRSQKTSSLLRGKIRKELKTKGQKFLAQRIVEPLPEQDVINEIFEIIRGFCLGVYSDYALCIKRYNSLPLFIHAIEEDP